MDSDAVAAVVAAVRAAHAGARIVAVTDADADGEGASSHPALSEREISLLRLVAQGRSNRDIGGALVISEATVKSHLRRIYKKLGISDRTGAAVHAVRRGLIASDDGSH